MGWNERVYDACRDEWWLRTKYGMKRASTRRNGICMASWDGELDPVLLAMGFKSGFVQIPIELGALIN